MKSKSRVIEIHEDEFKKIFDVLNDIQANKSITDIPNSSNPDLDKLFKQLIKTANNLESKFKDYETRLRLYKHTEEVGKIGGWELDIASNNLLWTNETFNILGVDKQENHTPQLPEGLSLFSKNSTPIIEQAVKRAVEFGEPYSLELEALTAKGDLKWVHTSGIANVVDGKIVTIFGTIQDISKRKHTEIENKFASDSMGFGTWNFDIQTQSLAWDDRMYSLYDVLPEDFEGAYLAWENTLSEKDKKRAVKDLDYSIKTGNEFNSEFAIVLKDGTERYLAGKGIVLRDDNGVSRKVIGVNWDITERVQKGLELQQTNIKLIHSSKLASLGEMSAGLAHEINNPLTIISGTIGLLKKYRDDPEKFENKISSIEKSCQRISRIVMGLKKFSRSGYEGNFKTISLNSIVQEVLTLTRIKSNMHEVNVTFDCQSEGQIFCDEVEIEQVLINLINNAIDAVKDKQDKWVKISVFAKDTMLVLRVMDSGNGIPTNIRSHLFDPFFTTKKVGEGTGLGLSIAKGILDGHNASIQIIDMSQSTCFEIVFPQLNEIKNAS
jgi:signal transduction histidine kinase